MGVTCYDEYRKLLRIQKNSEDEKEILRIKYAQ